MAQVQAFVAQTEAQPADLSALPSALAMGCKTAAPPSADVNQLISQQLYVIGMTQTAAQLQPNEGG